MKTLPILTSLILATLSFGCGCVNFPFESIEFPFAEPGDLQSLAAFGIPNWSGSEPHNGIDLIVRPGVSKTTIIAPVHSVVGEIKVSENPYSNPPGQLLISIGLVVNSSTAVQLVIEPGTTDPATKQAQRDAILVKEGQELAAGDPVASLISGEQGYTHLHLMLELDGKLTCAYAKASPAAKVAFDELAAKTTNQAALPTGKICIE